MPAPSNGRRAVNRVGFAHSSQVSMELHKCSKDLLAEKYQRAASGGRYQVPAVSYKKMLTERRHKTRQAMARTGYGKIRMSRSGLRP